MQGLTDFCESQEDPNLWFPRVRAHIFLLTESRSLNRGGGYLFYRYVKKKGHFNSLIKLCDRA